MTMEHKARIETKFVSAVLPWIVAAGGLAVYLATLNPWVSLNSLQSVAKVSGWVWQPDLTGPLYWLLTRPLTLLPERLIPLAVNLFSTGCAVLTLALLARSVAILPHDRTQEQRLRERSAFAVLSIRTAWLPPVLAAMVCGLQLAFWENATSASGQVADLAFSPFYNHCEMLDLLLLAYVIRCLLEFRLGHRDSWLYRAAVAYGLGMAGNWAMTGFAPLFVVALIWFKGVGFFNGRFLARTALWGLAGLSLVLLLPVVSQLADVSRMPFWPALKAGLGLQRWALSGVYGLFHYDRVQVLLLALVSLVPLLFIVLRWPTSYGDQSPLGAALAKFAFSLVNGAFLVACLYFALDPPFNPRHTFSTPCLTLYYVGALCTGYFSGYFLLVFGSYSRTAPRMYSPVYSLVRFFTPLCYRAVRSAVWLLAVLVPILLICRNLPQIRLTNGSLLGRYAALQAQAFPPQGAVLLSDDPRRLALLHAYLAREGQSGHFLFLDTGSLNQPQYHRFLRKSYGSRWPVEVPRHTERQQVTDLGLLRTMAWLAASNQIYYLHPSFGYYFELFAPEPHGLVYKMARCSTNTLLAPRLPKELLDENRAFWARAEEVLQPVASAVSSEMPPGIPKLVRQLMLLAHLQKIPNREATALASFYAQALDAWGTAAQREGQLAQAAATFQRALDLSPRNVVASVNLECNRSLQAGRQPAPPPQKMVEDLFGQFRNWDRVLNENGPFDEPTYCFQMGLVFARFGLYRQAAQQFDRARALAPDELVPPLWLARIDVLNGLADEALKVVEGIRSRSDKIGLNQTNLPSLLLVEASAHLAKRDVKGAETVVQAAVDRYPGVQELDTTAARVYASYGVYSNAIRHVETALATRSDDEGGLLVMAAQIYLNARRFTNALSCINTALAKHPQNDLGKEQLLSLATQINLSAGLYSNAVAFADQELKLNPNNPESLASRGYGSLQLGALDQAVAFLTRAMAVETNNPPAVRAYAQLNRAIAYLRSDKLTQAQRDYEAVVKNYPSYQAYYGLQEIAYRKRETNTVVKYGQLYLSNAPPNTEQAQQVGAHIQEFKPGPR